MGVTQSIKDFFRPSQVKALALRATGVQRLSVAPSTDTAALIAAYRDNQLVRACVDILADTITDPRLIVQERGKGDEWQEVNGHPFKRLLMQPNPQMDEMAFLGFAETSMQAAGVFYAEIVRSRVLPVELWPLQPGSVTPVYNTLRSGERVLKHYHFRDGMFERDIAPENMLVRDDVALGGRLPALASAMRHVDSDLAQSDYVRSFFNNAGVPSGLLKITGRTIDQEEADKLKAQWRGNYGRQYGNQHDVAVLDENADYQPMGAKLNELDSQTLRGFDEARICMAFGVPPLIVYAYTGMERATYSNLGGAWEWFWSTTMSAKLKGWRSFFTIHLLPEFENRLDILDEKTRLYWDISSVSALQENLDAIIEREQKLFVVGATTMNELRARAGYKEHADKALGSMNYFQMVAATNGRLLPGGSEPKLLPYQVLASTAPPTFTRVADAANGPLLLPSPDDDGRKDAQIERGLREHKSRRQERDLLDRYGRELYELANLARDGEIEEEEFINRLQILSANNLTAAFILGSLITDGVLTDGELDAVDYYVAAARDSAPGLAADIYNGRYGGVYRDEDADGEPASLSNRTALWVATASAAIIGGRVWRRDDPELTWRRGPTEEPCGDCLAFEGTTMKASLWRRLWSQDKLPQGYGLKCKGYKCLCDLKEEG